ncbi:MAG: M20/M25/M40 family metallo-hydrolase, partial [Bdellovibrionales bacterium]|nr:M20/M25/M40 family metallo-hydrolase [Bdellovibrionales bacterium]
KDEFKQRAEATKRRYAWDYDENYDLFVSDFNGKRTKRLTKEKGYDAEASYSYDGKWIVFASNRSGYAEKLSEQDAKIFKVDPSYEIDLYIMRFDGKDVKRLTTSKGYDGGPFFNADATMITWRRFAPDARSAEVFVMNRDGSGEKQLTKFGAISWAPYFHPSGDYLIFSSNLGGGHNFELYLVRTDGQGKVVQVTNNEGFDSLPVFSPDGQRLAWTATRAQEGKAQIFMADWDDSAARKALGLGVAPIPAHQLRVEVDRQGFESHVRYLSAPELAGRLTGSKGERLAGDYIAKTFGHLALKPIKGQKDFFHGFDFTARVEMAAENKMAMNFRGQQVSLVANKDWLPLNFSANADLLGGAAVFAGYGIRAPKTDEFEGYNSYADLDVKDKWVVVFRFLPEKADSKTRQHLSRYSTLRDKAMVARDLGAKGLILVSGPNSKVKNELIPFEGNEVSGSMSLPVISVTRDVAKKLMARTREKLNTYQTELDTGKTIKSIDLNEISLAGRIALTRIKSEGRNVVAVLPGKSSEAVVIGAHYDHLGQGHKMNSLARPEEANKIHAGADDNASGVAGVLEIAAQLQNQVQTTGKKLYHDVVFVLWSGEELGTLGSNRFIKDFVEAKKLKVHSYVNMDMIGRMNKKLIVQGLGSSPDWFSILEQVSANKHLPLALQADPYLPTDSTPFYLAKIPTINFFTGAHEDYHSPRDVADKVNFEDATRIVSLVGDLTHSLAQERKSLQYAEVAVKKGEGTRRLRIYIGTIPNYADDSGKGMPINGVKKGGPAEKAGIQAGDVVVEMGGHKIENIYDYTNALDHLKIGEKTKVTVKRKSQLVQLWIVPESRN